MKRRQEIWYYLSPAEEDLVVAHASHTWRENRQHARRVKCNVAGDDPAAGIDPDKIPAHHNLIGSAGELLAKKALGLPATLRFLAAGETDNHQDEYGISIKSHRRWDQGDPRGRTFWCQTEHVRPQLWFISMGVDWSKRRAWVRGAIAGDELLLWPDTWAFGQWFKLVPILELSEWQEHSRAEILGRYLQRKAFEEAR